ncbi:hypothetical protein BASA84_001655 [Batrachochytrium salamandrivorans]|nr:hypothetical protein BASA84_001655 [Batrachochytrium salamandrivorans]
MKLQGVFMIIPLLAVVASGSTIPSTDGYSVQRLEKRGDSDSDIKGSTAKNSGSSWWKNLEPKEVLNLRFRTDIRR